METRAVDAQQASEETVEHHGDLRLELWSAPGLGHEARAALLSAGLARAGQRDGGRRLEPGPAPPAWVKGGRLTAGSALRHGLRRLVLGRPFPRLREFRNLAWLRARGLPAPEPLLAGLGWRRGRPVVQFLATRWLPDAPSLADLARSGTSAARLTSAAEQVARLLADLHHAGFEHRDAFARNFVLDASGRPHVLDTWRGGPTRRARVHPGSRDLDDFVADGAGLLPTEALAAFRRA
jgi:hypothetical protein